MSLIEILKNAMAAELTATDDVSEVQKAWADLTQALNKTKNKSEMEEALEYTKSEVFIKCVALSDNYSTFIESFLRRL